MVFITPVQLLYETCLSVWLLSFYEPAVEFLATSRALPRLIDVAKGSTKEKVRFMASMTILHRGTLKWPGPAHMSGFSSGFLTDSCLLMLGCQGCGLDTQEFAQQRHVWCSDGRPWAATDCSELESTGME